MPSPLLNRRRVFRRRDRLQRLDHVPAERGVDRLGDLARLQREHRLTELRHGVALRDQVLAPLHTTGPNGAPLRASTTNCMFSVRSAPSASSATSRGPRRLSPPWSCPESCDAREDDDSTEEVAQMNSVRVREGQPDRVDGPNLHDHDRAAENYEERA